MQVTFLTETGHTVLENPLPLDKRSNINSKGKQDGSN